MDDDTRQSLLELAAAIQDLAVAVDAAGHGRPEASAREAGLAAQRVVNRLHGPGSPADQAERLADRSLDPDDTGLGGANTGGAE